MWALSELIEAATQERMTRTVASRGIANDSTDHVRGQLSPSGRSGSKPAAGHSLASER